MTIGDLIKLYRIENNLTTEAFAKLVGVRKGTVSRWETGDLTPSTENYYQLSQIMLFPLDEFIRIVASGDESETLRPLSLVNKYNVGINCVFNSIHNIDTLVDFLSMVRELRDFAEFKKPLGSVIKGHDITTEAPKLDVEDLIPMVDFNYDDPDVLVLRIIEGQLFKEMNIYKESIKRIIPKDIMQNSFYAINIIIETEGKGELIQLGIRIYD